MVSICRILLAAVAAESALLLFALVILERTT